MNRIVLLLTLLLTAIISIHAQVITASVEGVVTDPAGAAVPNAKVRAIDTSTNREVRTTTGADGRYSFPSLPPGGPYSISVEVIGFNTEERKGLTLEVNQAARLDFTLKIGTATETVQVTGEAPLV